MSQVKRRPLTTELRRARSHGWIIRRSGSNYIFTDPKTYVESVWTRENILFAFNREIQEAFLCGK
jgi:hypothetical protein